MRVNNSVKNTNNVTASQVRPLTAGKITTSQNFISFIKIHHRVSRGFSLMQNILAQGVHGKNPNKQWYRDGYLLGGNYHAISHHSRNEMCINLMVLEHVLLPSQIIRITKNLGLLVHRIYLLMKMNYPVQSTMYMMTSNRLISSVQERRCTVLREQLESQSTRPHQFYRIHTQ